MKYVADKEILEELLKEAESYLDKRLTYENNDVRSWNDSLKRQCERIYGKGSHVSNVFNNRMYDVGVYSGLESDEELEEESIDALNCGLQQTIADLKRLIKKYDYTINDAEKNVSKSKNIEDKPTININVDASNKNNISNSVTNSITIKSYVEVKEEIENNTYLDDNSKRKLLEKLSEIEKLENCKESKAKKWDIGKKILAFIIDKGADIAISYIPLILQAISK